jgi:hypothetical protein
VAIVANPADATAPTDAIIVTIVKIVVVFIIVELRYVQISISEEKIISLISKFIPQDIPST